MFAIGRFAVVSAPFVAALAVSAPAFAQTCAPTLTGTIVAGLSAPAMSAVSIDDCTKARLAVINTKGNTPEPNTVATITKNGDSSHCIYTIKGIAPNTDVFVTAAAGLGMHFALPALPGRGTPLAKGGQAYVQYTSLSLAASAYGLYSGSTACTGAAAMKPLTIAPSMSGYKPA